MAWVSDDGRHESYLLPEFLDGCLGGTSSSGGVWATVDAHGAAIPYSDWQRRDRGEIVGWVLRCDERAGADGQLALEPAQTVELGRWRRAPSPAAHDPGGGWVYVVDDDAVFVDELPDVAAVMEAIVDVHIEKTASRARVRAAAAASRAASEALGEAVRSARLAGWSWTAIGSDVGITRQSARERWRHLDEAPAAGDGPP